MLRAPLLALALGSAPAASGCDASRVAAVGLAAFGRPSLRLVDATAGARLARGSRLLQARGEASAVRGVPGARAVGERESLAEAPAGRRFLVVSDDPALALRLGARLAREGAADVAVVGGGLPPWGLASAEPELTEE